METNPLLVYYLIGLIIFWVVGLLVHIGLSLSYFFQYVRQCEQSDPHLNKESPISLEMVWKYFYEDCIAIIVFGLLWPLVMGILTAVMGLAAVVRVTKIIDVIKKDRQLRKDPQNAGHHSEIV